MEPIRVLQVFARLDRGGAEGMIMNVYRNIDRSKVQFDFVVNEQEKQYAYEPEIVELGGRVFRVPLYTIKNHRSYKKVWENLLKNYPEWKIIHGHHTSPAFVYLRIAKVLNILTIAHSHTASGEMTSKSRLKLLMRYPLRYIADHRFACSKMAARWMFGKKHVSTFIVKNAIVPDKFAFCQTTRDQMRKDIGIEDKFVIGHVGRFQPEKNHDLIIDIFKLVHTKHEKAFLILIGDGELYNVIQKKVQACGLNSSVYFAGVRADVPELYQAMDLFLFPSLFEGLGIVAVEAQAAGLPVIAADTIPEEAYVTDLIEKELLKSPVNKWADRILKYASGYKRIDTSEQIKSRGYDIAETAKWLEEFYLKEYEKLSSN